MVDLNRKFTNVVLHNSEFQAHCQVLWLSGRESTGTRDLLLLPVFCRAIHVTILSPNRASPVNLSIADGRPFLSVLGMSWRFVWEKKAAQAVAFTYTDKNCSFLSETFSQAKAGMQLGRTRYWFSNELFFIRARRVLMMCVQATQITDRPFSCHIFSYFYALACVVCNGCSVQVTRALDTETSCIWVLRSAGLLSPTFKVVSWGNRWRARSICIPVLFSSQGSSTRKDILGRNSSSSHKWSLWRLFLRRKWSTHLPAFIHLVDSVSCLLLSFPFPRST